ncbi:MAG: hypothetical protein AVDCRST_MAG53-359 [uncultured Solirubrobacteraceae bacterium]|uniref:Uncharacterized protein n=1 Tax=uncultured Solirubrobacteraceae bacterium TaxID=1162706 RepID=A0A6J4RSL3_9ACTN|nr:MAG: hypothetical protein AVDCRST_MAG53-359 [uncultured Solirubrobacteraceae bacterium]
MTFLAGCSTGVACVGVGGGRQRGPVLCRACHIARPKRDDGQDVAAAERLLTLPSASCHQDGSSCSASLSFRTTAAAESAVSTRPGDQRA